MRMMTSRSRAFTLIELLIVIAIIALLISILLPALQSARRMGQTTKCQANLHHVAQAMAGYLAENAGIYPPAYIYPYNSGADYDLTRQEEQGSTDPANGYLHWSWFLYGTGQTGDGAFACPTMPNGGHPRTNPGRNFGDWEREQIDQFGSTTPSEFQDRQAPRMAYAGNAAIFPRNKFTSVMSGGQRVNRCVNEKEFASSTTILLAEMAKNWKTTSLSDGGGWKSKSHRPINPFNHIGSGTDEYGSPEGTPGFTYGQGPYYGLVSGAEHESVTNIVDGGNIVETNAVGRHHPGNDPYIGGSANFLYADGHAEKKNVLRTIEQREWGFKFYSVTGDTRVGPPW